MKRWTVLFLAVLALVITFTGIIVGTPAMSMSFSRFSSYVPLKAQHFKQSAQEIKSTNQKGSATVLPWLKCDLSSSCGDLMSEVFVQERENLS